MNTTFALLARYQSPVVSLKEICQEFLGLTPKTAEQKASAKELPFPTFKLRDSERSPTLVKVADLGEYMDNQYAQSRKDWDTIQQAKQ
ncbi:pyocin activator PrtN family protein [Shewanella cutis]|uniref:Pyocin activator protein PrtN n=2 Tax=Shewanella TaxID=22 RepID=Q0HYV2_SHESR|nr:pyocin activator PrtN family protein [Shewanella sp. PS-2]MCG9963999.1 pyocin activator PrtN family protein [Shewanella sp. PS-2]